MTLFRVFQLSIAALIVVAHVWIVQAISAAPGSSTRGAEAARVAAASAPTLDNHDNSGDGDNGGSDNGSAGDNDSGDNDGGDNDSGDNDGGDNDGGSALDLPSRTPTPQAAATTCSTPGQETLFQSANQRVGVRVFPSTEPSIRVEIRPVFDLLSIPTPPGQLVGLLIYDVVAGVCVDGAAQLTPIRVLPAEVNLNIQYTDTEVLGLDESRLEIAHLDFQTVQWTRVEKQALNVAGNAIGATITQTGYYVVYQRP